MLSIFESVGRQLQLLGVSPAAQFTSATTLVSYVIGVSTQNAMNGRQLTPPPNRAELLENVSAQWRALDAQAYPFTRLVAAQLREHDDRAEFLAGIELILGGIEAAIQRPQTGTRAVALTTAYLSTLMLPAAST